MIVLIDYGAGNVRSVHKALVTVGAEVVVARQPAPLAYAQKVSRDPVAVKESLALWLAIWRDLLLLRSGSRAKIINLDWQDKLQTIAHQISLAQIKEMVARLRTALMNLEYNVNPRLNLEIVLLKLPMYADNVASQ